MENSKQLLVNLDPPSLAQSVTQFDQTPAQSDQRAVQSAQLPSLGRAPPPQSALQSDQHPPNAIAKEGSSQGDVQSDRPPTMNLSQLAQPPTQDRAQLRQDPTQSAARAPAAPQADCPPKKKKKMSTSEMMAGGREVSINSLDRKTPTVGDEATCALITWSNPKGAGRWRKPAAVTRKKFAVIIGGCWDELHENPSNPAHPGVPEEAEDDGPNLNVAVFLESHKDGQQHYHAVLQAPRTTVWHHLPTLLRDRRIACDVQIGVGAGVKHVDNMLRYCMIPTTDKFDVDDSPFFSPGPLFRFLLPPSNASISARSECGSKNKIKERAKERSEKQ